MTKYLFGFITGDIDYIRRKYDDSNIPEDLIKEIYAEIIKNDIALKINTSGIRRNF